MTDDGDECIFIEIGHLQGKDGVLLFTVLFQRLL